MSLRDTAVVLRYKRARAKRGERACDACGWTPPLVDLPKEKGWLPIMHAHHCLPISCGGHDHEKNLALLCPNCHSLAHAISTTEFSHASQALIWRSNFRPDRLVDVLKRLLGLGTFTLADVERVAVDSCLYS